MVNINHSFSGRSGHHSLRTQRCFLDNVNFYFFACFTFPTCAYFQDLRLKIRENTELEQTASESQRNTAG